jgi:hypothetical protein
MPERAGVGALAAHQCAMRRGSMKRLGVLFTLLGLMALTVAPASAASGSMTVQFNQTGTCTYEISASWGGLGGRTTDTVVLAWYDDEVGPLHTEMDSPVSGRSGTFTWSYHITGHPASAHHLGSAYLLNKNGRVVHGSTDTSAYTSSLEACP